jgi:hypothetical protein
MIASSRGREFAIIIYAYAFLFCLTNEKRSANHIWIYTIQYWEKPILIYIYDMISKHMEHKKIDTNYVHSQGVELDN